MSINNPNINKFFNKLYLSFPNILNIDKSEQFGNVKYVYTANDSSKWFSKIDNDDYQIFLFGQIKENIPQPPLINLTFDKNSAYSKDCSGIINAKNVYINVNYFIENYPNFRTKLTENTINIFINGNPNSVNVINLGDYVDGIDMLISNINTLLNELDDFKPIKELEPQININENNKTCEICGKKLKKEKLKICKKCSNKRHAANILVNLLKYVEPQTPFEKSDLNIVYKEEIEVDDCIWSLEAYNLLIQNKNEYSLINAEKLNEFIEKYANVEETPTAKEEKKDEPKKLNKRCNICKKTLPSSKFYKSKKTKDGFEDYCKSCKKYVNAANYLKEILNEVSPGNEFKETDLKNNFKNPLEFNGRLWELQSFDLLIYDSDKEIYKLADLDTCQNFLDKYYIQGSITIKPEIKKENDIKDLTKEQQMDSVIESIKNGKTEKEAAKIAGINLYKITHWFNEGKNNCGEQNIKFYNRYIEAKKEAKINSFKNFYVIETFNIKPDLTIADTLRKQQMEKVLKELGSGSSLKKAAFNSGIAYETLQYWYKRGKQNFGEEYAEFYEKINILQSPIDVPKPDENFKKEKSDYVVEETEDEFIIPEIYKHILDPLPHKFKQIFKGAKESESGFAWVRKEGGRWRYIVKQKNKSSSITRQNIYDLYCEVKKQGHIWGVRNLENAKETLKQSTIPLNNEENYTKYIIELNIPELYKHILDPISSEYSSRFRKPSSSGIAWVNKINNTWAYANPKDDKYIYDANLYNLYLKVKKENLPWGVRDLEKAKESLAQCEIPKIQTKTPIDKQSTNIENQTQNEKESTNIETKNRFENENTNIKTNEINCICFEENNNAKIIINGLIENDKFLNTLYKFKSYEDNIKKIISDRHTESTELFIELEIEKNRLKTFKDRIKNYGWKIIN